MKQAAKDGKTPRELLVKELPEIDLHYRPEYSFEAHLEWWRRGYEGQPMSLDETMNSDPHWRNDVGFWAQFFGYMEQYTDRWQPLADWIATFTDTHA